MKSNFYVKEFKFLEKVGNYKKEENIFILEMEALWLHSQ